MRRTKEWWSMLNKGERVMLVILEQDANKIGSSAYLPVGYGDCAFCSTPTSGGGLCIQCLRILARISNKPERMMIRRRAEILLQLGRGGFTDLTPRYARRFVREMMCDKLGVRYTGIKRIGTVYTDALCTLVFHPALGGVNGLLDKATNYELPELTGEALEKELDDAVPRRL